MPYLKIVLTGAVLLGSFGAGWVTKSWRDESIAAAEKQAVQAAVDVFHEHEARVGQILENKLADLRAKATVVERVREKIVDRPVYSNVCIDDDGLRLIEAARLGAAPASEPAAAVSR